LACVGLETVGQLSHESPVLVSLCRVAHAGAVVAHVATTIKVTVQLVAVWHRAAVVARWSHRGGMRQLTSTTAIVRGRTQRQHCVRATYRHPCHRRQCRAAMDRQRTCTCRTNHRRRRGPCRLARSAAVSHTRGDVTIPTRAGQGVRERFIADTYIGHAWAVVARCSFIRAAHTKSIAVRHGCMRRTRAHHHRQCRRRCPAGSCLQR
jgi:hypothetical protein